MAQQLAPTEHHKGRAMRDRVGCNTPPPRPQHEIRERRWTIGTPTHTDVPCDSAALCQVYDSIFLDVPMSRVKFNVNTEYAYIQNFKILQSESLPAAPSLDC